MTAPLWGLSLLALSVAKPPASVGTNDIRDIRGPVKIPMVWLWICWGVILVAVAVALYFLWRWWRKKAADAKIIPPMPPHLRAREKLQNALALIDEPKPFIVAVSDTVRVYLEERFVLRAPERTTEEFLLELQASPMLTERQKQSLADFLQQSDLVKFARYEPVRPELREIFEAALRLVDETTPRVAAPELGQDASVAAPS